MFKYLWYLLKHKFFVFRQGRKLRVPYRQLLVHDLSKFQWDEFIPYYHHFYVKHLAASDHTDLEFDQAWHRHVERNPHHWDHWVRNGDVSYMPDEFSNEMLADWSAMSCQQGRTEDVTDWYYSRRNQIKLHPDTRKHVEDLGYETGLLLVPYEYWKRVHGLDVKR